MDAVEECRGRKGFVESCQGFFGTFYNAKYDLAGFTKRMFCLDKHKISPEFLCYLVDNVDKSV